MKRILSTLLVVSMLLSNLTLVGATNMDDEKVSVPEGTFTKEQEMVLNEFISKSDSDLTTNGDEVVLGKKDESDHHALLKDGQKYDSFTYEADITLNEGSSAGLLIGVKDQDDVESSWFGVNFNTTDNDHRARLFKVEDQVTNYASITSDETSQIDFSNTIHMFIEFDENGNYIFKISNLDSDPIEKKGKVENWQGGYIGLLTFDSSATFNHIKFKENKKSQFETNLEGIVEDEFWNKSEVGLVSDSKGEQDVFLLSESVGDNFVYEADIKFNERKGAASLVFRANEDLDHKNMYVANLNGKTGEARVFKFEDNDTVDLAKASSVALTDNNEYHLKVTMIDKHLVYYINGELVINTADYTMNTSNDDSHYGQSSIFDSGLFGLLTWNSNVTYQNVNYTKIDGNNSPQLTNLSVASVGGKVDKNIQFSKGQYVYITYVDKATTAVKLLPEIGNDSEIVATNEEGKEVDINNLPITKDINTYTLTVRNKNAKVVYRVRVHRMQSDDSYYNEDYRGQYHYSVKDGWGNDPCGTVYFNGEYHLFYQYTDDVTWGPMHWAHSTSKDLITWEEQPIVFYPDEYGTMFSGCAVVANHETAPDIFDAGEEGMFFMITANGTNGRDGQRLIGAYSKDGKTFHKYDEGKVLLDWKDDSLEDTAFRDPKIFRYENKWFLVVAGGPLRIYSSDDLVNWKEESAYQDLHTECPDLYPLTVKDSKGQETGEVKWVLNRGGRKYKIGDFKEVNGQWSFVPDEQYASPNAQGMGNEDNDGIMNFGSDSYAGMTYYKGDFGTKSNFKKQDIVAINWMNTWDSGFLNNIPNATGNNVFNGTYNLQCDLGVTKDSKGNYYLTQTPIDNYETLRDQDNKVELKNVELTNDLLKDFKGSSYEVVANIKPDKKTQEVGFKVRTGNDQETVIKYNLKTEEMTIDRLKSGIIIVEGERMNVKSQNVTLNEDGSIDFHIYVDRGSVEVFSKDNTVAGAMQIFANPLSEGIEVYSTGGTSTGDITIYPLKSIWKDKLTPTKPLSVGLNKTEMSAYVGDEMSLSGWVTPKEVSQEIVYSVDKSDVVELVQEGNKAKLTAKKDGVAIITVTSKADPTIKNTCTINVYKNNFKTNLSDFEAVSGHWYVDDKDYIGKSNDNAFLYANKIENNKYKYEVDASYESGILNFIFQSQTKNAYDGCYSLQLAGNTVRLFDFKNDYTFTTNNTLEKASDNKYHVEIDVDGNNIIATINGVEYINEVITETDRQYNEGYVGLGLYNTEAHYQNFYVTTDSPITKIVTQIDDLNPTINASIKDIQSLLPKEVIVAGDDNLNKKDPVAITWDLSKVDASKPGTYTIIGSIAGGVTTSVKVNTRSNVELANLVKKSYDAKNYTGASYKNYTSALKEAKACLDNSKASQKEIDLATKNLNDAITHLVSIKELNETIEKYKDIDQSLYTKESYQKYLDAFTKAKEVLNKADATQKEVDDAILNLTNAVKNLVKKEDGVDNSTDDTNSDANTSDNANTTDEGQVAGVTTGDESNISMYLTLLGLACLGLIVYKKKKYNQ